MSIKAVSWAFDQQIKDPLAKLVLIAVADHINESTGDAWPSVERLEQMTCASRSTVIRKLKILETTGFLQRTKRYNKTDLYQLNMVGVTQTGVTQTPLEVSHRHTNHNRTVIINNKGKSKKQLLVDWSPDDTDKQYATELGIDWKETLTDITLWNEKNGNKAAYASCRAFWQGWLRKEAKARPARSNRQESASQCRTLTHKQQEYAKTAIGKLFGKYKDEGYTYEIIEKAVHAFMLTDQSDQSWRDQGTGLPRPF
ncbi:MAG: helix-turn-helix domain-containing protein [Methylophilaceae bacterium]|nr:helix-turn-helix domain-containing protein [Methylophilaceae bacterium]